MRLMTGSIVCVMLAVGPVSATPDDINSMFISAAASAVNSVVSISIYDKKKGGENENYPRVAYGTGTIIDREYIVTNCHVVTKGNHYQVMSGDGIPIELERFENGRYYLADQKTDIALMKIRDPERLPARPVVFEDSNRLSAGEWVLAIGNPYGLRQTITHGIVSSTGRDDIGFADIEDFIQSDVPINPGNSGGPLVNLDGKLVGINTAIRSESGGFQGISFAIPSNLVRQVCRELIAHGRVRRGWIGFLVKEMRSTMGKEESVLKIISVIRNSPAESAGLRTGDIIRDVDGEKITTLGSLIRSIGNKPVGTAVEISVSRDGRLENARLVLRERTVYKNIRNSMSRLFMRYGMEVDENSETGEIIISYVSPKSIAYNLKKGDIIRSVNGTRVTSLESFIRVVDRNRSRIERMTVSRDSRLLQVQIAD